MMHWTEIAGGADEGRSLNVAASRCVNLYPEALETSEGKTRGVLYSCPGLVRRHTLADSGPIRAMASTGTYVFVLAGRSLWCLDGRDARRLSGNHPTETGPASLVVNDADPASIQVGVADGGQWCCYTVAVPALTATMTAVVGSGGQAVTATMASSVHGYGVLIDYQTNKLWTTGQLDLATVNGLAFANLAASLHVGELRAVAQLNQEVWCFGTLAAEVWRDVGTTPFPLARQEGTAIEDGIAAPWSLSVVGHAVCWLGRSQRGALVAYVSDGYSARRISTHGLEARWLRYSTPTAARGYAYQQGGHTFWCLAFLDDKETWCWDARTGAWHQRASQVDGDFGLHPVSTCCTLGATVYAGDPRQPRLYSYELDNHQDDGQARRWLRSWRAFREPSEAQRSFSSLRVDLETGNIQDQDARPTMALRWSDDGGHTWSGYRYASMGRVGETAAYARFNRLGGTRPNAGLDRLFEISSDAPMRAAILGARLETS